jgi:hypothetical protein
MKIDERIEALKEGGRREVEERNKKIRTKNKEDHRTVLSFFFKKKLKDERIRA